MRALLILFLSFIGFLSANGQQAVLDVVSGSQGGASFGWVKFYDPAAIGSKKAELMNYADIEGSPFWSDKWTPAFLYLSGGSIVKLKSVKLNFYTNQIHYLDNNGTELVTDGSLIKKLVFLQREDSTKVLSIFEAYPDFIGNKGLAYYRVLNDGRYRLMEMKKSLITTAPYDALAGKSVSSFFSKTYYALTNNAEVNTLKALNKEAVYEIVHPDSAMEDWVKQNKNKLKNDTEVLSFLDFVNYYLKKKAQ